MPSASPSWNSPAVGSPPSSSSSPPSNSLNSTSHAPPPQLNPLPPEPPSAPAPQLNTSLSEPPNSPLPQLNLPPATVMPPQQSPSPSNVTPPSPPPLTSTPLPSSPPPQPSKPPPMLSSPPPNSPTISPPPPLPSDPPGSPPSLIPNPPPPPSSDVPKSPPPPSLRPPNNPSPSPPQPPIGAPPIPLKPPESSPPLPSAKPPKDSPPQSPPFVPPSPPTPFSNSPPRSSSQPLSNMSPPPPSFTSLPTSSPPPPFLAPPGNTSKNISSSNAPERSKSTNDGGIVTGGTVAVVLALSLLLLGIFGTAACCVWKRRKRSHRHNVGYIIPTSVGSTEESDKSFQKGQMSSPNSGSGSGSGIVHSPHESGGLGNSRSWFTYKELLDATNGFSNQNLLGEGGFGSVYKGTLTDGREVAVKHLKIGGRQGEREFKAEVEIISRVHHRHLVSLVGYCISDDRRLLVYDYLPNDTLYFHLHGEDRPVMDWATRVKIAVGAAHGIAYLHEDCHPRIIHRDIKSSNILLDNNFEARVSDFGLAKLAIDANSHITTRVMGTFGYMAPEYASSGKLTEKSDVYSFGVVLLELITGRKPVDTSHPLGAESLVEWARPLLSHVIKTQEFNGLADPRLRDNYTDSEMFRLIEAAAACVRHSSAKRPKMGQVVRAFDSMATSDLTNGMKLGESEMFNPAQQSDEIRMFQRMAFGGQNFSTNFFLSPQPE